MAKQMTVTNTLDLDGQIEDVMQMVYCHFTSVVTLDPGWTINTASAKLYDPTGLLRANMTLYTQVGHVYTFKADIMAPNRVQLPVGIWRSTADCSIAVTFEGTKDVE